MLIDQKSGLFWFFLSIKNLFYNKLRESVSIPSVSSFYIDVDPYVGINERILSLSPIRNLV